MGNYDRISYRCLAYERHDSVDGAQNDNKSHGKISSHRWKSHGIVTTVMDQHYSVRQRIIIC